MARTRRTSERSTDAPQPAPPQGGWSAIESARQRFDWNPATDRIKMAAAKARWRLFGFQSIVVAGTVESAVASGRVALLYGASARAVADALADWLATHPQAAKGLTA